MRLAPLAVLLMTACAEHGSGTSVDTFARLPVSSGYTIGFDRDHRPLLGFSFEDGPIARATNGSWLPVSQEHVRVFGFGADTDGTPVVVHGDSQLGQIHIATFRDGTLTPLGEPLNNRPVTVLQHTDGTRYAVDNGFAFRLAPGASTWTTSQIDMFRAVVAPDGSLLAWTRSRGLVRVEANDTATTLVPCTALGPSGCSSLFAGVDADGRMYFATFDGVRAFEAFAPTTPIRIELPQNEQPIHMITSPELSIVAAFGNQMRLYALPRGASTVAAVRLTQPLAGGPLGLHTGGDGAIYVSQNDWLGIATQIGGD
ncbi:MAG: hypothetical protein KF773_13635 [Deltaproteobacteria bacterium]|nr:hypothetical protein [Deltaproteobacteria bacterium]